MEGKLLCRSTRSFRLLQNPPRQMMHAALLQVNKHPRKSVLCVREIVQLHYKILLRRARLFGLNYQINLDFLNIHTGHFATDSRFSLASRTARSQCHTRVISVVPSMFMRPTLYEFYINKVCSAIPLSHFWLLCG